MKTCASHGKCLSISVVCAAVIFFTVSLENAEAGAGWQNHLSIYGWLAGIDGTARYPVDSGPDVEVEASDVLENLNGVFMGNYEGSYDRWSILFDAVYLNINNTENTATRLGTGSVSLDIKSWVLTGAVGYDFVQTGQVDLGVLAGVRYLSLDTEMNVGLDGVPLGTEGESESLTDGIVGIKGVINFNEHWFVPYYADIGTGTSDYSYQLFAALGYRYKWFDITLGYRHLYFSFADDSFMADLEVSGPKLGIGFTF